MTYVIYVYLIGACLLLLFSAYMAIDEYISKSKKPTLDELRSIWFSVSLWPAVMPVVDAYALAGPVAICSAMAFHDYMHKETPSKQSN